MTSRRLISMVAVVGLVAALGACSTSDGEPPSRITNQTQTSWPTQGETADVTEPVSPDSSSLDP